MKNEITTALALIISMSALAVPEENFIEATFPPAIEIEENFIKTTFPLATEITEIQYAVETAVEAETATVTLATETVQDGSEQFETMADLYNYWFITATDDVAYPDYVCGVWTETGDMSQLVVAVTKDEKGEAGKQEILSLIGNDESISFTYQSYSYRELYEVKNYVIEKLQNSEVMNWGCGIDEMKNTVTVDIDTSLPEVQTIMKDCFAVYGNMVIFNYGGVFIEASSEEVGVIDAGGGDVEGIAPLITIEETSKPDWWYTTAGEALYGADEAPAEEIGVVTAISISENKSGTMLIVVSACAAALIIMGIVFFSVRKSRVKATDFINIAEGGSLTTAQTEKILELKTEEPDSRIFDSIMNKVEE